MTKGIDYTALTIALIGAINWGLIGFFNINLVSIIFGNATLLSRIVYSVVGIAGIYMLSAFGRIRSASEI